MSMSGRQTGPIRIEWKYASDFKRIEATNIFGMGADYDFHLLFGVTNVVMGQDPGATPRAEGEYRAEIVMPFRTMKELRNLLDEGIKNVELRFGEIKLPKTPEDVFKQP